MLFERQNPEQSADQRLAQLLSERPVASGIEVKMVPRSRDFCRAVVITLLLTSVAGTWSLAFFLGHP